MGWRMGRQESGDRGGEGVLTGAVDLGCGWFVLNCKQGPGVVSGHIETPSFFCVPWFFFYKPHATRF